ncbi:hypothetical protein K2Z84_12830 [Candidatus Binatia bacterium]|nr:hypothetical protein [Candidatus Binatia bacterium]
MRRRSRFAAHAATVLVALALPTTLLSSVVPRVASAADAAPDAPSAAPAPAPSLALSDKPPLGCCCIATNEPGSKAGCTYGLSEDACRTAGKAVATWSSSWTPGKCAAR